VCIFWVFAGDGDSTAGVGRRMGRGHCRSPVFWASSDDAWAYASLVAVARGRRADTVPAVAEGFPCNFWSLGTIL
jgi:hypothetical protein